MRCWGLTIGSAGMVSQVRALSLALGLAPEMKEVALKKAFGWLPSPVFPPIASQIIPRMLKSSSDPLTAPWPDLVVSCGRRGAIVALGLKAHIGRQAATRFIHIQDPQMSAKHFDLIVAMEHDHIRGDNVIKTKYALHAITPAVLDVASKHFAPQLMKYPKPRITVLLGGSTNKYRLNESAMRSVIASLEKLLQNTQGSLLITPSRRTGERNLNLLRGVLGDHPRVFIYDDTGENPYLGMLAMADAIVVTNDSVNMMSEGHATGRPLYVLLLPGHMDTKPARFAERMINDRAARPLTDHLDIWSYPASYEMQTLATEIRQRLLLP